MLSTFSEFCVRVYVCVCFELSKTATGAGVSTGARTTGVSFTRQERCGHGVRWANNTPRAFCRTYVSYLRAVMHVTKREKHCTCMMLSCLCERRCPWVVYLEYPVQLLWRERALCQERRLGVARRALAAAAAIASHGKAAVVGVPRCRCWNMACAGRRRRRGEIEHHFYQRSLTALGLNSVVV